MRARLGAAVLVLAAAACGWVTFELWHGGLLFLAFITGSIGVSLLWALVDNVFVYRRRSAPPPEE